MYSLRIDLFFIKLRWPLWLFLLAFAVFYATAADAVSDKSVEATGEASYYSQRFVGRRTTSGEPYDDKAFTAAHPYHPFGTYLLVTHLKNQQSAVVRVNDRFRPRKGHLVDVSMAAAKKIDLVRYGRGRVTVRVLNEDEALRLMDDIGQAIEAGRLDSVTIPLAVPVPTALPAGIPDVSAKPTDLFIHGIVR